MRYSLSTLAGQRSVDLGRTAWMSVDQLRVNAFGAATEDFEWIHVDTARAANGPFGGTILHGFLTLSLVSKFFHERLIVSDAKSVLNYGLDRVRFPSPVRVDSRLRGHVELLDVATVPRGLRSRTRITVEVANLDKPGCVADMLTWFEV